MFDTSRRHILLAGFMGTGKSAVGRALAKRLDCGSVDLDEMITSLCRRSISDIFKLEGEATFRQHESRALRLAVISPHSVIALGGGTPLLPANANIIRATGRCWLLTAAWEAIWERVRGNIAERPILAEFAQMLQTDEMQYEDFVRAAKAVLEKRSYAYAHVADHVIDTSGRTIDDVARQIVEEFNTDLAGPKAQ